MNTCCPEIPYTPKACNPCTSELGCPIEVSSDCVYVGESTLTTILNLTNLSTALMLHIKNNATLLGKFCELVASCPTLNLCIAPQNLNISNITQTTASVNWQMLAGVNYDVFVNDVLRQTNANSPYALTGLNISSSYVVKVVSKCSSGATNYTAVSFTSVGCGPVSALAFNSGTKVLSFSAPLGQSTFIVKYKISSNPTFTTFVGTPLESPVNSGNWSINLSSISYSPNSLYDFQVTSNCSGTLSLPTELQVVASPTCATPTNLNVLSITNSSAVVSWNAVAGASSYEISINGGSYINAGNVTTYNLNSLTGNTVYNVNVRAVCSNGSTSSATSNFVFTTLVNPSCAATASVSFASITHNSATINWVAVAGASSYSISINGGAFNNVGNVTTFNATGLTSNSVISVTVVTNCTNGLTSLGTTNSFNTTLTPTCAAPSSLLVTAIATTTATLTWGAVVGASIYNIYLNGALISTTASPTYNYTGLVQNSAYVFGVSTTCSNGLTSIVSTIGATTTAAAVCNPPSSLTITSVTTNSALLSWIYSGTATSYEVRTNGGAWTNVGNVNSYNLTGLTFGTAYTVDVRSVCSGGLFSTLVTGGFTTDAGEPTGSISVATCATLGQLINLDYNGSPAIYLSGSEPVIPGESDTVKFATGGVSGTLTVEVSVAPTATDNSIIVIDSTGAVQCQEVTGIGIYIFTGVTINIGTPFSVSLNCADCGA